ncbi:inorganic phosphate transporter [Aquimarina muelleri]|uniref:Phosphate transporter n=1 Tax=Aquimarina muelleri TaxID=279356 RepID=A0A918N364_9FLAO|nr:inorganic phosphate transporter [Aquimarina muelleri]MCX2764222.1 inorganic phosphate transporter [Aquimarina muelleri]GGX08290.1 phosphate transporter [Aquimarina muelleri]
MDNIYLLMVVALAVLAIADLIVGVSNDAVNFLNSAIGSKAVSFRTIMIVASIGIAAGAIFSSGLMEVARKGIFNPSEFYFDEIMIIFMAVMITDILLLDFFNTLGMPTSTTVSIVFNLLGAAVCIALIKIGGDQGLTFSDLDNYINTKTATKIITGILLSVVIAFSVGAIVQFITRLLLSYDFEKKAKWVGAIFGGIALTALLYFIFIKGIKGTNYAKSIVDVVYNGGADGLLDWANNYFGSAYESVKELAKDQKDFFKIDGDAGTIKMTLRGFLEKRLLEIVIAGFLLFSSLSYILVTLFKVNIYKLIIVIGTFALALAFSGNDLVNFIGVPIAGWQSYEAWVVSGVPASEFSMNVLATKVDTPVILLFLAGTIMVLTLWFSKKARYVAETEINLSREGEAKERFKPNFLSRGIVRGTVLLSQGLKAITPTPAMVFIEKKFTKPVIDLPKNKTYEMPAFDMVRAAVNLMVAGVLISIATSMGLPLSTTYVTFMVAMGTSLADRAWGTESAVYRVAGVLNVIGGWFFTAIMAFIAAAAVAFLINLGGSVMIAVLLLVAVFLLARNTINYRNKVKAEKAEDSLKNSESTSVQGVIEESADNIKSFVNRGNKIYISTIDSLVKYDLIALKKTKKGIAKLDEEVEHLRDNIFYFIKNLDESSIGASNFYINILGYLQDMSQSLDYISKASHKHVNNNHKKLRFNQIKDLKEIEEQLNELFEQIKKAFSDREFDNIDIIINEKQELFNTVNRKIDKQVARTRTEENSPKNTTLYFGLLLETKDLITATMNLLETYREHK